MNPMCFVLSDESKIFMNNLFKHVKQENKQLQLIKIYDGKTDVMHNVHFDIMDDIGSKITIKVNDDIFDCYCVFYITKDRIEYTIEAGYPDECNNKNKTQYFLDMFAKTILKETIFSSKVTMKINDNCLMPMDYTEFFNLLMRDKYAINKYFSASKYIISSTCKVVLPRRVNNTEICYMSQTKSLHYENDIIVQRYILNENKLFDIIQILKTIIDEFIKILNSSIFIKS